MARLKGSIQSKKGWWYFVRYETIEGRRKKIWRALGTKDKSEAAERAAERHGFTPPSEEEARLQRLIDEGERARANLALLRGFATARSIGWTLLFERWQDAAEGSCTTHGPTLENYRAQLSALSAYAAARAVAAPADLDAPAAEAYARALSASVSPDAARRAAALFRRVWRSLGLGTAWESVARSPQRTRPSAARRGYRRLSTDEVSRLIAALEAGHAADRAAGRFTPGTRSPRRDLADAARVAYYTGLRRGDVRALTSENIEDGFLRVLASKTASRGLPPLLIPIHPHLAPILRAAGRGPLFPSLAASWPKKTFTAALEAAGIRPNAFGKAGFHSLRATFISMMDEAGIAPHVTDAITGHKSAGGMHGRYTQPSRAALADAVLRGITPLENGNAAGGNHRRRTRHRHVSAS